MASSTARGKQEPLVDAPASFPALRWDVEYRIDSGVGVFTRGDTEYRFEGLPGEVIRAIISRLDGRQSPSSIAHSLNLQESNVLTLAERLFGHDLAVELTEEDFLLPEKFSDICRRYFPLWKERLFSHPLWQQLRSGQASRAQFMGWLLESYHFIEGVNDRLALAVAECFDTRVRSLFAHHFTEEYDHSHFFLKALKSAGLDEAEVLSARPLPSTLAILNFMRQCARRDPIQYAVCSGFLESTGAERAQARAFYTYLSEHYFPDRTEVIRPLVNHVNLDEAYGHNLLMEEVVARIGRLQTERASAALDAGSMLVETLELWSSDIQRSYDRPVFATRGDTTRYRPLSRRTEPEG